MPLACLCNIVGVNHHGKTIIVALSFIHAESTGDFTIILDCLDGLIFYGDNVVESLRMLPQIIIIDQAAGFRKVITEHSRWCKLIYQLVLGTC
jgi:hypothetical protein